MNRLTVRYSGIHVGYQNKYNNSVLCSEMTIPQIRECMERLAAYEDTGFESEQVKQLNDAFKNSQKKLEKTFDELLKYKDLEEQDLLIKLPCKLGTELFYIKTEVYADGLSVWRKKIITEINLTEHNIYEINKNFGKTVFLTREEAEKALEDK